MSLCTHYEHLRAKDRARPRGAVLTPQALTPAERAQEEILAKWLALDAWHKNARLTAVREREGVLPPATPTYRSREARTLTFEGQTRTVAEWARVTGWHADTIYKRLQQQWPLEKLLTRKPQERRVA